MRVSAVRTLRRRPASPNSLRRPPLLTTYPGKMFFSCLTNTLSCEYPRHLPAIAASKELLAAPASATAPNSPASPSASQPTSQPARFIRTHKPIAARSHTIDAQPRYARSLPISLIVLTIGQILLHISKALKTAVCGSRVSNNRPIAYPSHTTTSPSSSVAAPYCYYPYHSAKAPVLTLV